MRTFTSLMLLSCVAFFTQAQNCPVELKHLKRNLNSAQVVNLCDEYQGKTVLFVNTASYCGFTPQFEGLEALYDKYKDKGLVVLGFPSHDFNQEDNDEAKTAEFCQLTYGVSFPMFEATSVKGEYADPLFSRLSQRSGVEVKWNFYKYLMAPDGSVVKGYSSTVKPNDKALIKDIEALLVL